VQDREPLGSAVPPQSLRRDSRLTGGMEPAPPRPPLTPHTHTSSHSRSLQYLSQPLAAGPSTSTSRRGRAPATSSRWPSGAPAAHPWEAVAGTGAGAGQGQGQGQGGQGQGRAGAGQGQRSRPSSPRQRRICACRGRQRGAGSERQRQWEWEWEWEWEWGVGVGEGFLSGCYRHRVLSSMCRGRGLRREQGVRRVSWALFHPGVGEWAQCQRQ